MDRLVLTPGALLVIYSDGVTEAFDVNGEAYAEDRLRDAVAAVRAEPAQTVSNELLKEIDGFCSGAPQADDITILALRFT
jgi:sigma-B regulation protein RsbU (phosphoserine phosphatase)